MQVVREDDLLNFLCKGGGVIARIGADAAADARRDIAGAGSGVALARRFAVLVDAGALNDFLQGLVDFRNLLERDAGNLKPLAGGQVDRAVAVLFRDGLDFSEVFGLQQTAGDADTGGGDITHLGDAECVFLQRFGIHIHNACLLSRPWSCS